MPRLDHVNILARDGKAMVAFLTTVLDAREGFRPAFNLPGHWLYLDGIPAIHVNYRESADPTPGFVDHIAFGVFDAEPLEARIKASGYRYEKGDGIPGGVGQFFVFGPEGVKIELQHYR
jgi:catechol 2,3-dioxygenase-like lactoylglutathione lyase family enzyme